MNISAFVVLLFFGANAISAELDHSCAKSFEIDRDRIIAVEELKQSMSCHTLDQSRLNLYKAIEGLSPDWESLNAEVASADKWLTDRVNGADTSNLGNATLGIIGVIGIASCPTTAGLGCIILAATSSYGGLWLAGQSSKEAEAVIAKAKRDLESSQAQFETVNRMRQNLSLQFNQYCGFVREKCMTQ
ncbi:hypothetical protein [Parahaliea mediterranea]|uniref:hypothetical protein n=1 Tax=Parahaliea mediterranea TaxID=651086 RepID=UPI0013005BBA|nr:hypothetical protein [Parahaliea mediterranea]